MREIVLKILVGGAGGVGKTTILHRYLHDSFINDTSMTIGVQFHTQLLRHDNCNVKLALWDMGGQERFRFLLESYAEGGRAAYVLFSIVEPDTMDQVEEWIALFKKKLDVNAPVLIVGTKLDRATDQEKDVAREFAAGIVAKYNCIGYVETSSKTGHNVEHAIMMLVNATLPKVLPASCLNT